MRINNHKIKFYVVSVFAIGVAWVGFMGFMRSFSYTPAGDAAIYAGQFSIERCGTASTCYGTFTQTNNGKTVSYKNVMISKQAGEPGELVATAYAQSGLWLSDCTQGVCTLQKDGTAYTSKAIFGVGRWLSLGLGMFGLVMMYATAKRLYVK